MVRPGSEQKAGDVPGGAEPDAAGGANPVQRPRDAALDGRGLAGFLRVRRRTDIVHPDLRDRRPNLAPLEPADEVGDRLGGLVAVGLVPERDQVVDRAGSVADVVVVPDGPLGERDAPADGVGKRLAVGQPGGDGGRQRTPRAEGRVGGHPGMADGFDRVVGHQHVQDLLARDVPAFPQRGVGPHRHEALAGQSHTGLVLGLDVDQHRRLVGVRRHERRLPEQVLVGRLGGRGQQPVAGRGDHHRVHDQRTPQFGRGVSDRLDHLGGRQHTGLDRRHGEIVEDRVQLRLEFRDREHVARFDAPRVLGGHRGECRDAEPAGRLDGLQIRLVARAATGVAARHRQDDGRDDRGGGAQLAQTRGISRLY